MNFTEFKNELQKLDHAVEKARAEYGRVYQARETFIEKHLGAPKEGLLGTAEVISRMIDMKKREPTPIDLPDERKANENTPVIKPDISNDPRVRVHPVVAPEFVRVEIKRLDEP